MKVNNIQNVQLPLHPVEKTLIGILIVVGTIIVVSATTMFV